MFNAKTPKQKTKYSLPIPKYKIAVIKQEGYWFKVIKKGFKTKIEAKEWAKKEFGDLRGLRFVYRGE